VKNHLNYYKKIKSIPTVNLSDLNEDIIFLNRKNYYFNIGLTKNSFEGKSILELCPGTGYNAYFLLKKFKVKNVKLVDNNPSSIKLLKKNLSKYKNISIHNKDINKFNTNKKFDFVIIENALDNFSNDKIITKKAISFAKSNGNIIFTIGDKYGILSIKIRYILSLILLDQKKIFDFKKKIHFLSSIFKEHLKYLSKNTRKEDKWVLDNIINSDFIRKKNYIDYLKLIKIFKKNIYIQNTSPHFHKNLIFYKNFHLKMNNSIYLNNYLKERKNFLDFETEFKKDIDIEKNLNHLYNLIYYIKPDQKIDISIINKIRNEILKITKKINITNKRNKVYLALNEFLNILEDYKKNKIIKKKTKYLKKFWGIYNQHILLYKNK
jgi:protein-L-isoaspartate O-methyltransferase